jgi:hypothetical protein
MLTAVGDGHAGQLTLKEAARRLRPLVPVLEIEKGRHYLYFELFQRSEALT